MFNVYLIKFAFNKMCSCIKVVHTRGAFVQIRDSTDFFAQLRVIFLIYSEGEQSVLTQPVHQ